MRLIDVKTTTASNRQKPGPAGLDPDSWVERYGDSLFAYALICLRDRVAAEDLVQETFLHGWASRDRFSGEASEKAWLKGILRRKIADHWRERKRDPLSVPIEFDETIEKGIFEQSGGLRKGGWVRGEAPGWWPAPGEKLMEKEFWEALHGCFGKMPSKVARVFFMREVERRESAEICRELQLSRPNFWVLMHRARLALRRCLEGSWLRRVRRTP